MTKISWRPSARVHRVRYRGLIRDVAGGYFMTSTHTHVQATVGSSGAVDAVDGNVVDEHVETRRAIRRNQNLLLLASIGLLVASFLPWIETALGSYHGFSSVGRYTFYVAWIGIAGGLVPSRRLAGIQAVPVAVAGIGFPIWQCLHLYGLVGFDAWVPGTGMLIMFVSGFLALRSAVRLVGI